MRRGMFALSLLFLLVVAINFASADSLSNILNQIDQSTLLLFVIFIIAFVVLFFSLKRMFKNDTTTSGIISIALALLITYGVNKTGFDLSGLFENIGISQDVLYTAIPLIIVVGIVFMIIKLKKDSLLAIGGLLIAASFFVYIQAVLIVIGIALIVARVIFFRNKNPGQKTR